MRLPLLLLLASLVSARRGIGEPTTKGTPPRPVLNHWGHAAGWGLDRETPVVKAKVAKRGKSTTKEVKRVKRGGKFQFQRAPSLQ
jgi:hypothetical protein